MVNVPATSDISQLYSQFRVKLFNTLSPDTPSGDLKFRFQSDIKGRRKFEKLHTYGHLIKELEKQLIIHPRMGKFQPLRTILETLPNSTFLLQELTQLERQVVPIPGQSNQPVASQVQVVPDFVMEQLARNFDKSHGRDWESFAEGLGRSMPEREKIRVLPGEIDQAERENPTTLLRLEWVLRLFQRRCRTASVTTPILTIIISTLRSEDVFGHMGSYNRLARELEASLDQQQRHR